MLYVRNNGRRNQIIKKYAIFIEYECTFFYSLPYQYYNVIIRVYHLYTNFQTKFPLDVTINVAFYVVSHYYNNSLTVGIGTLFDIIKISWTKTEIRRKQLSLVCTIYTSKNEYSL